MTIDEAKAQLKRVFVVFPSYREWLEKMENGNDTLNAWCRMISSCDLFDVSSVVDEIVEGRREPTTQFQKPDALPRNILEESRTRRGRRSDSERQFVKYHQAATEARCRDPKFGLAWRAGLRLGKLVRDGKLTTEQNKDRMALVLDWLNG